MSKKALILEHQRHIARLIQVNLARHEYESTLINDIRELPILVQKESFDLIVLNTGLSGSAKTLEWLKSNPETCNIPILKIESTD